MTTLQERLIKNECQLLLDATSHEELKELESELPSDVHLVEYHLDGDLMVSGIRGYRMVDIFDALFDHGAEVVSIIQGYGRIKPKLFGIQQANEEE
jgi:hypothetical protein|tara:strand:- start:2548 stop:2835 length:288 start_codon:yes stop_codon:yes gene_type:complete